MFLVAMMTGVSAFAADNEIFVDQVGASASIDLEQMGTGNMIGGLNSTAGNLTAFDLDGATMTLDVNQIGDANKFLGDINADTVVGMFQFDFPGSVSWFDISPDSSVSS